MIPGIIATPMVHNTMPALSAVTPPITRLLDNGPAFKFVLNCTASDTTCAGVKAGFENAGQLIANSLNITSTINVKATFRSFCQGKPRCTDANTLGQASAAAYFPAKDNHSSDDSYYFYPQALIKQLPTSQKLQFNEFDIIAEFNADFPFYFKTDTAIAPNQTDFTFVVAHELTHGLGFDSGWADYSYIYREYTTDGSYLAPIVFANGPDQKDSKVTLFEPFNVFDRKLVNSDTKSPLTILGKQVTQYTNRGASLGAFITGFERSGPAYAAAQAVRSLVSKGSKTVSFLVDSGEMVGLQTGTNFETGTSIVHLDYDSYWQSAEFLMIPRVRNLTGKTLEDIIRTNTNGQGLPFNGAYGPLTRKIMASIGWSLPESPSTLTLNIAADFNGFQNSGTKFDINLLLFFAFVIFISID